VKQGGQIVTVPLDVTDRAQVAALWSKVPPALRDVDILGEHYHHPSRLLCIRRHFSSAYPHFLTHERGNKKNVFGSQ